MGKETYIWSGECLGRALAERRKSLGMRQCDVARDLGYSARLLSEIENGRDTVAYGKVLRYAGYLAMDLVIRERLVVVCHDVVYTDDA